MNEVKHTRFLDGSGLDPSIVGAKGAALDRLIALEVPVPPTAAITTDAYRAVVAQPALHAYLQSLRSQPIPPPEQHSIASREVDEVFLGAPIPQAVSTAIATLAESIAGSGRVAVRSSATAEDLGSASFAGQYRSFLDVDPGDVERAVRLTWASLWHPAPRAYRRFHGVTDDGLAMSVLLMQMLEPDLAGVVFTRDPASTPHSMRIEFVHGLGESLVSGAATPDACVVERTGDQASLARVSPALATLPPLALRIEHEFGRAQDIEWAIDGGRLWIVQARPITVDPSNGRTTDDGFDVGAPDADCLTTAGIAEMLPGVIPPRLWELNSWLVEEGFRRLFDRLGADLHDLTPPHSLVARYRARAAIDLGKMQATIATIPGGSPAELERQYFGSAVAEPPPTVGHGMRQGWRTLRTRAQAAQESEIVIRAIQLLLDQEPVLTTLGDDELDALCVRLRHLAARAMAAEIAISAMAASTYRSVEAFLERHLATEGTESLQSVAQRITGHDGSPRTALSLALGDLAREIRSAPQTSSLVSARDLRSFAETAIGREISPRFHAAIRRAGSRSTVGAATWEEAPELAWKVFQALVGDQVPSLEDHRDRDVARRAVERRLRDDRGSRASRALTGQVIDVRASFLRREADDAAELLGRREHTKAAVLMLGGIMRRVDRELGSRLHARDLIEQPLDIEMLSFDEAINMRNGSGPTRASIDARRRRLHAAVLDGALPHRFHGDPPPVHRPVTGTVFQGWAASPGRYEGRARVVHSVDSAQMARGDVLVARSTDSSWTPLFFLAGAIVVEEGGPLSHAAIVARELGVPAVLNLPGLIDRLGREIDDVTLTVDGNSGEVAIRRLASHDPIATIVPTREPAAATVNSSGMNVFVTGLIGAGALMSTVVTATESLSGAAAQARLRRKAAPIAAMTAEATLTGFDRVCASPTGVRDRRWFTGAAATLGVLSILLALRSSIAYWHGDAKASASVLSWAAATSSALTLAFGAAVSGVAARSWPRVPLLVRRLSTLASYDRWTDDLSRQTRRSLAVAAGIVASLAALATGGVGPLQRVDNWIYDGLEMRAGADRWAPDWMNHLGQPIVVIPLAIAMAVFARRCRVLAAAIPAAIVGAGLTVLALTWLTTRPRPVLGGHAGEQNSFPGGHVTQLTLIFGLLPLVVHLVTARRVALIGARVVSTALLTVLVADTLRTGGHWPSDQLAGILIGLSILLVVHTRYRSPSRHDRCNHRGEHPTRTLR